MDYTKLYRIIGIYNKDSGKVISNDSSPGYLHMHTLDNELLKHTKWVEADGKAGVLYQWGNLEQKASATRYVTVSDKERSLIGCLGIGSIAVGREVSNDFFNGGEAFIYGDGAFRVIKGNKALPIKKNDGYWLLQSTSFKNSFSTNSIKSSISRQDLVNQISDMIDDDRTFVTTFIGRFRKNSFKARSNGILTTDTVDDRELTTFSGEEAIGGHVIGDSNNIGDQNTPGHNSAKIELKIEGEVKIEVIEEIEYLK